MKTDPRCSLASLAVHRHVIDDGQTDDGQTVDGQTVDGQTVDGQTVEYRFENFFFSSSLAMAPKINQDTDKNEGKGKMFRLQTAGVTQTTYTTVLELIAMEVQRTYDQGYHVSEVLTTLRNKMLPAPVMQVAEAGHVATADETAQWQIDYKGEHGQWLKDRTLLKANLCKAYALIYSTYCAKSMQNRLEEDILVDPTIKNDPVKLLRCIKTFMYEQGRSKNPCTAIKTTILQAFNFKQGEAETLTDYNKRFKQHVDLVEQLVGTHILESGRTR